MYIFMQFTVLILYQADTNIYICNWNNSRPSGEINLQEYRFEIISNPG